MQRQARHAIITFNRVLQGVTTHNETAKSCKISGEIIMINVLFVFGNNTISRHEYRKSHTGLNKAGEYKVINITSIILKNIIWQVAHNICKKVY